MIITHKIKMDLARKVIVPPVNVVQDDKYSRKLEITLTHGGAALEPPSDAKVVIRYRLPNGVRDSYDTLPGGTAAGSITGNAVTVALAPQVCAVAGRVELVVGLISDEKELHTFVIALLVERNPGIYVAEDGSQSINAEEVAF